MFRHELLMNNGQIHLAPPARTLLGVRILGSGSYLPELVVSNHDLHETHGFDPDWIVNRTGIHERRFALPHQATSDLCVHAATRCLKAAGREPADVDLLVVATFTPDMAFPSTANLIQDRLKLACPAFDVQAACAGFVFALVIAAQFVATGNSQCALVIGGDCNSRVINPGDQKSFPLFGDGAGAVLLAPGEKDQGLVAYQLGSDGSGGDLLSRPACGSRIPPSAGRARKGPSLPDDGRPGRLQMGRANPRRFIPGRARARRMPGAAASAGSSLTRPTFASSTPPATFSGSTATPSTRTSNATATPRPARSRSPSMSSIAKAAIDRGDLLLTSGFGAGLNWGTALWRW